MIVLKGGKMKNKPNSTFLYPCILASVHSCYSPNEPNLSQAGSSKLEAVSPNEPIYPVHPVNPVKNMNPSYISVLSVAKNMILQNKPNFVVNHFKTTISAKKYQKNIDL
ncbi:MAG: hypothetical protein ABFD91_04800, partial [Anaerohalosphaeraceae bacterium]